MSESDPSPHSGGGAQQAADRIELVIKILSLLYGLACLGYLAWVMIPDHLRRQTAMKILARAQHGAGRAAFRAGHQAMALELSGRGENYEIPYRLSLAAARAGQAYEKLRRAT